MDPVMIDVSPPEGWLWEYWIGDTPEAVAKAAWRPGRVQGPVQVLFVNDSLCLFRVGYAIEAA